MNVRFSFVSAVASAVLLTPMARGSVIAYDNTPNATTSNAIVSNNEWADDLHMIQAGPLESFTFEYEQSTSSSVTIRFYTNDATNTTLPSAATLIAEFPAIAIPGGGASGSKTVTVMTPVVLPQHVWMSFQYDSGGQIKLHNPPTVGSSSSGASVLPEYDNYNFDWGANFPFQVVVAPTPGTGAIVALASAVVLVRRRS